jgi:hypothetical protein
VGAIGPFLNGGVFDPHDIHAMSVALDEVCKQLGLPDGNHPARQVIAERIIALAEKGERSPIRLRDRLLHEANGDREL